MIFYNLDIQILIIVIVIISLSAILLFQSYLKHEKIKAQFNLKTLNKSRRTNTKHNLFVLRRLLLLMTLVMIILTFLRPKWGTATEQRNALGIDIVFSLDISESMKALDYSEGNVQVNRLDTAKKMMTNFVQSRPSDRFGLVVFAGEAFVSCPLTTDHNTFLTFLNSISFDEVTKGGTNLGEALKASLDRFIKEDNEEKRSKIIVLITDGEDQESGYEEIIDIAKDDQVQIFTIGLGSKDGSLIPIGTDVFGRVQYKQYQGQLVKTSLDETTLKIIADSTGAKYFNPKTSSDLDDIHRQIEKLSKSEIDVNDQETKKEQFTIFAILSLIIWVGFLFIPDNI